MDLYCPHCTQRVTVPDAMSGQVANCPQCAKPFMTPALGPPPMPEPAPAPATPDSSQSTSVPPPLSGESKPAAESPAPESLAPPGPALPAGYTQSRVLELRGDWMVYVPPAGMLLVLMLSIFPWKFTAAHPRLLWQLTNVTADHGSALFLIYALFMLIGLFLAFATLGLEMRWYKAPPATAPFVHWKELLVGFVLALGVLLLTFAYLEAVGIYAPSPILLAMKLAYLLHLLATIGSFALFRLQYRQKRGLPPPQCELRW